MQQQQHSPNGMPRAMRVSLAENIAITSHVLGINPRFLLPDWVIGSESEVQDHHKSLALQDTLKAHFPHIAEVNSPMDYPQENPQDFPQ